MEEETSSFFSKIKMYLNSLDFLVKPYEFKVSNGQSNSTFLGGCLTLLIIIFGSLYFASIIIRILGGDSIIYAGT
jgi:hypothetical protein